MKRVKKGAQATTGRYGIWRYWAPGELLVGKGGLQTGSEGALPLSSISRVLSLTEFSNLKSLNAELSKCERGKIPQTLHRRLCRLFEVQVDAEAADRPIEVKAAGKSYQLPYPFIADKNAKAELVIVAISFEENTIAGTLEISARIEVSVRNYLRPRVPEDQALCNLIGENQLLCEKSDDDRQNIIVPWLVRNKIPTDAVRNIIADNDHSFTDLSDQIRDRIEELVLVSGASELLDNQDCYAYLFDNDGEESGFIAE